MAPGTPLGAIAMQDRRDATMPVYDYTALDARGKTSSGIIDAESALSARQRLRATRMYPVTITEVQETETSEADQGLSRGRLFRRVSPSEIAIMTRQLATLIGAKFQIVPAMDTLIPQTKSKTFKKVLSQIKDAIVEGKSFYEALSAYPEIFSPLYANMVNAGESSGTLEIVMDRLADITEKQQALKRRIRTAMAYPVFMSLLGVIVLCVLLAYIVPNIVSIFSEMEQVLPAPTLLLISISDLFRSAYFWVVSIVLTIAVAVAFRAMRKTPAGRRLVDRTMLLLPGVGILSRKLSVVQFTRTLGSLLENGVQMLPALDIVRNVAGNTLISEAIQQVASDVERGQMLGNALSGTRAFPTLTIQMVQVGEQSGELEPMLSKIADVFEGEVESTIMSITSLLQPVMLLLMGVVVAFIIMAILIPIFEMNQLVF